MLGKDLLFHLILNLLINNLDSVLFSSGDSGVANRYNAGYPNSCLNALEDYVDNNGTRFSPSFPVNCPYVTAGKFTTAAFAAYLEQLLTLFIVGGTELIGNSTSSGEKAAGKASATGLTDYYSGGGFSNYFELPSYQADAVTNFLTNYGPDYGPNVYNTSGKARGFPDVAAIGLNGVTVFNGTTLSVGGTSLSSPIVAGIVTRKSHSV